jgi:protein-tyrosine-phosphatase
MRNEGLSLDNHKSQSVTRGLIEWADITLCMTTGHRDFLINHYPKFAARIYTLCEYAGENGEIDDPYGQSMASYEQCAVTLRELIIKVNNRLSHQGASI